MERSDAGTPPDRNWARTGLVLCSLLVVIAAAVVLPAFGTDGVTGSPIEEILPGESAGRTPGESRFGGSGSGLGALNPGESTGVGGDVGLDSETFATTDTKLHFTVESTRSTYWRTGAYDRYTGSGWERTGDATPFDGTIEYEGSDGERIDWEIEFQQRATAVPTAWRPTVIDGVDDPQLTAQRSIRTETPIDAGDTVEGVSYTPQRNPGILRTADTDYPAEIEEQYTQLPGDTPARLERFTADLTRDDETPYEKAVTIENWLEESKEYDLGVSERSDQIATSFVFEMEAGYCEYFATAMVSMLRSQDVPARYVVGYSSGQQVGEDTYEVRSMNAHAWVEVYFEDIGWVRFDPTPAEERLAVQEAALESSGQQIDPGEIRPPENLNPGTGDVDSSGFETTLNQTALPGEPVEVSVTYDSFPIIQETVYFNGEPVGETDSDGTVVGIVPDADELRISIGEEARFPASTAVMDDGESTDEQVQASGGASASSVSVGQADDDRSDTHPIERTASIAVSGDPTPGETITVTATAGDLLLDGATIRVDGERIGQTGENGQIDVRLPDEPGSVTVAAKRGLVSGDRTIEIPELTLAVERGWLPAMATGTVTVRAQVGDEPAAGVPVEMDGEQITTTGADGTATVRLPLTSETGLAVVAAGQTEQVVLGGLLWRLGATICFVLVAITTPLVALLQRGYGPGEITHLLLRLPGKLAATGRTAVVAVATNGEIYLGRVSGGIRRLFSGVIAVLRGERSLAGTLSSGAAWFAGGWRRIAGGLATLRPGSRPKSIETESRLTVQQAWRQFLDELDVGRVETRTPGELASYAVEEEGLPEEPVLALRDTFREVEYGSRPPTDRLDRVQDAIDQIQRANDSIAAEGER